LKRRSWMLPWYFARKLKTLCSSTDSAHFHPTLIDSDGSHRTMNWKNRVSRCRCIHRRMICWARNGR
jgi:hypothetical protein